ncbi:hypothetical protein Tco_0701995 [Tanacetum coccineum]|uniref:Uncharacterized protein n=1 Tax=Tanacetum coccineum TaxID=301880 RepID=A0ABQ4XUR3_9ASTR
MNSGIAEDVRYRSYLMREEMKPELGTGSRGAKFLVSNSKSGATSVKWSLAPEMPWHQNSVGVVVEPVLGSSSIAGNSVAPLPPHENAHVVVVSIKRGRGHPRKSAASAGDVGGSVEVVEQEKKKHRRPKLTSVGTLLAFSLISFICNLYTLRESWFK